MNSSNNSSVSDLQHTWVLTCDSNITSPDTKWNKSEGERQVLDDLTDKRNIINQNKGTDCPNKSKLWDSDGRTGITKGRGVRARGE